MLFLAEVSLVNVVSCRIFLLSKNALSVCIQKLSQLTVCAVE